MDTQSTTGMDRLKQHILTHKVDMGLWTTRGLTLIFSLFYLIPIFGNPYNTYYKALAAYASTSALRLHQRQPNFRLTFQFLAFILVEDSFHYLIFSMIFFYVAPFTLVLIPIFCFSLIHIASYSIQLLDHIGPNFLWMIRLFISLVEFKAGTILDLIAFTEIILMPFCVVLAFIGRASFLTPVMYHQFLKLRYKSQRNPSTRNMFSKLKYSAKSLADHRNTPTFVRYFICTTINFVTWLEPSMVATAPPPQ